SIPGGGGEILVQEIRDRVARKKAGADRWLEVMEIAHRLGLRTSVTMMYGLGETTADRIEHLFRVREVQRRTGGFTAFICWPLQPDGTGMADQPKTDALTYLRILAMARIVLENVPNLQSSWVTMGLKVGQVALRFGANDFGSLMMEENVVSSAGTTHRASIAEMERCIRDAGYAVRRRRHGCALSRLRPQVEGRRFAGAAPARPGAHQPAGLPPPPGRRHQRLRAPAPRRVQGGDGPRDRRRARDRAGRGGHQGQDER